jgi:hypothetical protein
VHNLFDSYEDCRGKILFLLKEARCRPIGEPLVLQDIIINAVFNNAPLATSTDGQAPPLQIDFFNDLPMDAASLTMQVLCIILVKLNDVDGKHYHLSSHDTSTRK